jgi:hypothetical protein
MTTRPAVPPAAVHIHEGEAGVAGDIVVTLEAPAEIAGSGIGLAIGCPFPMVRSWRRSEARVHDPFSDPSSGPS